MGTKFTPFIDKLHELVNNFKNEMDLLSKIYKENPPTEIREYLLILYKIQYDIYKTIDDLKYVDNKLLDYIEKILGRRLD